MNQEALSFSFTQIDQLVSNLNKKNFEQNSRQIASFIKSFGLEADRHLLRCLFSSVDFSDASQSAKHSFQVKLLNQELNAGLSKSSFITNICFAIDNCFSRQKTLKPAPNIFGQLLKLLNCSPILEVVISLALTYSKNPEFVRIAENQLKLCIPSLIQSYVELAHANQEGGLSDISPELLQLILSLLSHDKYKKYGIPEIIYRKFVAQFCQDFPRELCPLILAPLIYSENTEISAEKMSANSQGILTSAIMDTSWANLVMDIGYAFTANIEDCKNHLVKVTGRDLSAQDVAKIISLMCRTHTTLSDLSINLPVPSSIWSTPNNENHQDTQDDKNHTANSDIWKPEIFVQALKEVTPNLDWKDVCIALDHSEFVIKDRAALVLLMKIVRLGSGDNFPADVIYRLWKNSGGQLSLISMILKNSDVYSFADHIFTNVPIELLKILPETEIKELAAWKSMHLVEVLIYIADNGQGHYGPVLDLFKMPMQFCPDILFIALLQINTPMTFLMQEIFATMIPIFLNNHPNGGTILHHAWHSTKFNNSLRNIIIHSMSDWYMRGGENDQLRLTRVLDVAQDLKALSTLLNVRPFQFVIDLACLASRREYLKLDKWLTDKIRENGEPFVQSIIQLLHRRCPQIINAKISEDQFPKVPLPNETLTIILTCLQTCIGNVQQEISDAIVQMTTNCSILMNKQHQQPLQSPLSGVMRRGLDANILSSVPTSWGNQPDIASLSSNLVGLNLAGPGPAAGNFNLNTNLMSNLTSMPTSPSRLLQGQTNSPFQLPIVPLSGITSLNNMNRIPSTSTGDKMNMTTNNPLFTDIPQRVSKEVEDEANGYFQQIYNHSQHPTLSINEVLDMLQRFKESTKEREREVQQCMVRNLFEEYRFFPQYPDKELQITGQLFGGIIERNLVPSVRELGIALRYILEALRKDKKTPEGLKMFQFGITSLDQCKNRLHLYPNYCEHVQQISNFNEFPPHLIEYVKFGCKSIQPPNKLQGQLSVLGQAASSSPLYRSNSASSNSSTTPIAPKTTPISNSAPRNIKSIANATNINTLLVANADREEKIKLPPDAVQDKTAFIFNNLSQINMQAKCDELREIMLKDYWPWLSQYMVLKRASIELNFHALYSNFLDALKNPELLRLVTNETFRNIRVLLRSAKGFDNFSDRSLLKNLGHWLGLMTLARNRPILHVDLDLKSLLLEAYHKGQQELLFVVPFVAKIVESCAKAKVFKPPNPWTMGIMNALAELHQEPDLKLNLKFEIEVLCKTLSIEVADLKPGLYLNDPERLNNIEYQLSQPKKEEVQKSSTPQPLDDSVSAPMSPNQTGDQTGMGAPEAKYAFNDITIGNMSNLSQHIVYSPNITLLHAFPQLKNIARTAIERTIADWVTPVVSRSVRISVNTCEQIIRKDFALNPDEAQIRKAAHYMVRNLAAGMAMITCRDQLNQVIQKNIVTAFASISSAARQLELGLFAAQIANDNTELACAYIQKAAVEKAIAEIESRLTADFELRKTARQDGRQHCDTTILSYQQARIPEQIRLKTDIISSEQFTVYDEFARNIPGFQPMNEQDVTTLLQKAPVAQEIAMTTLAPFTAEVPQTSYATVFTANEIGFQFDEVTNKMESFINNAMNIQQLQMYVKNMHVLFELSMAARRMRDERSAANLLNRAVDNVMEDVGTIHGQENSDLIKHYRDIHLRLMNWAKDTRAFGPVFAQRIITKRMLECRDDIRYNLGAVELLLSSSFGSYSQYDIFLSQLMDNGNNFMAVTFAMQLVQYYFIDDRPNISVTESDFCNTIEMLVRLAATNRAPDGLPQLIEMLRAVNDPTITNFDRVQTNGPTSHIHSGILQVRTNDLNDPVMAERVEYLLKDWVTNFHINSGGSRDAAAMKSFGLFVNKLNLYGVLKTDELITRFFTKATQWCIDLVRRNLNETTMTMTQNKAKIFHYIDAFVRLIALIVKYSGDSPNATTKINLLNKILGIIVGVLLLDQEHNGTSFQQLGYHRIFIMLFLELNGPELDSISLSVSTAFCHTYHILRPSIAPGFCYSWLEVISHRVFIGRVLALTPQQKGWAMYSQLLLDLFRYMAPFLRNAELAKPVQLLYKGTLRVLLVLLHDFPEFLGDYHFGFCDVIPSNCIQLRNLILAAFPRNMRLPDPFTPNLKVDMLNEIANAPRIFTNFAANIQPVTFKKDLDAYLKARAPVTFLSELRSHLQVSNTAGQKYNLTLMNALVLYVGTQAIAHIRSKNLVPNMTTIVHCSHMDIFQNLIVDLDHEGRYLFLNAIANQLRYPNSHTHYFSCTLLYLFVEANSEAIQEQITRVLLERLIVNRPHPWGLLITFIELIKNPVYKFWDHDFVHCAPEIEKLFESVARSCMMGKTAVPAAAATVASQQQNVVIESQECN